MKRRMLCGYVIEVQTTSPIPHVTLQKLGSKECGFFTPEEAKKLADAILRAAQAAEAEL